MVQRFRGFLETFVRAFPQLRFTLQVRDAVCYTINGIINLIWFIVTTLTRAVYESLKRVFKYLNGLLASGWRYKRLDPVANEQIRQYPVPYRDKPIKRILTYHVGLILGASLYIFVYYVLVKHHSWYSVGIASLVMCIYMIILENSHNIRSILMLSLPIMFTNRGRALIYCLMLSVTIAGPVKNSQGNIGSLHSSLNCCKNYLIVETGRQMDKNVVQKLVRVEDVLNDIITSIKSFADEIRQRFRMLLDVAIQVEQYLSAGLKMIKDFVDNCNSKTQEANKLCLNMIEDAYKDCQFKLGPYFSFICEIVQPVKGVCRDIKIGQLICEVPGALTRLIDSTIGYRLRQFRDFVEKEFYANVDIKYDYSMNETQSKSFFKLKKEIKFDVNQKFWYINLIHKVFNLISLILVIWILITATLYHMHYLTDIKYDNIYLDSKLHDIEHRRFERISEKNSDKKIKDYDRDLIDFSEKEAINTREDMVVDKRVIREKLFPITRTQEGLYLKSFTLRMSDSEQSKLCISGLIWSLIIGYIFFFVLMDYSLFKLIELINDILKEILFKSELPLVDIESNMNDRVIHYNRTYLKQLREFKGKSSSKRRPINVSGMYKDLMEKIEASIPDDILILESLEQCLPKPNHPDFVDYKRLCILAVITWFIVIIEAYALRTRHCIADLYFPYHAKKRALWLYRKLLNDKPKYEDIEKLANKDKKKLKGKKDIHQIVFEWFLAKGKQRKSMTS